MAWYVREWRTRDGVRMAYMSDTDLRWTNRVHKKNVYWHGPYTTEDEAHDANNRIIWGDKGKPCD